MLPTERSMPPVMMTKVIPKAPMATEAICVPIFAKFLACRK